MQRAIVPAAIALLAGFVVFVLAHTVFSHHSTNHDEGVYLLQASMLLEGQLELFVGEMTDAFRPWFFVEDGGRLYPKYQPVFAAIIAAVDALFGAPRLALAAVAAGNTALVYLLGTTIFSRRVGLVAAVIFAASPMGILASAVFLPYAPTTFFTLSFIVAYIRGLRNQSVVYGALAGIAIGIAFFARPFTAVLVGAPFILHASYRIVARWRRTGWRVVARRSAHHAVTAVLGLGFVGLALAYNYRMTGDLLVFPYEAFAPLDGPGFGRRQMLGHVMDYTPDIAIRANLLVLWNFATRWFTAGLLGTLAAIGGLGLCWATWRRGRALFSDEVGATIRMQRTGGVLLAAVVASVTIGNVLFWGNFNILGAIDDPTDGLISLFGPIYHFDLLALFAVFAAVTVVALGKAVIEYSRTLRQRYDGNAVLVGVVVLLLLTGGVVGMVNATLVSTPVERNAAYTEKYEAAYEPIDRMDFEDDLVFLPTPYGQWQQHPFQYLRNTPTLDGPVVYALDQEPAGDFEVIDAYPDRSYYRYTYRGDWTSSPSRHVTPTLVPLTVETADTATIETNVGVPDQVEHAVIRLEGTDGTVLQQLVEGVDGSLSVDWFVGPTEAGLDSQGHEDSVRVDRVGELALTITLVQTDGSTLTYRQELSVGAHPDHVDLIWPPERFVCTLVTDCGTEGTYLPDDPEMYPSGVWMASDLTETG